jgi:hypothetical protein
MQLDNTILFRKSGELYSMTTYNIDCVWLNLRMKIIYEGKKNIYGAPVGHQIELGMRNLCMPSFVIVVYFVFHSFNII